LFWNKKFWEFCVNSGPLFIRNSLNSHRMTVKCCCLCLYWVVIIRSFLLLSLLYLFWNQKFWEFCVNSGPLFIRNSLISHRMTVKCCCLCLYWIVIIRSFLLLSLLYLLWNKKFWEFCVNSGSLFIRNSLPSHLMTVKCCCLCLYRVVIIRSFLLLSLLYLFWNQKFW
jgi:hypothetical protein